jgi:hypothetical protein
MQKQILSDQIKSISDRLRGSIFEMNHLQLSWPKNLELYLNEVVTDLDDLVTQIEKEGVS